MASLETLLEATLASSAAIVLVLLLRRPLRGAFGARVAYGAWALVPASLVAVLVPAAEGTGAGATFIVGLPAALPGLAPRSLGGTFDPRLLLGACWLAGMAGCAAWMVARQLRFRRSLGRLLQRPGGVHEAEHDVEGLPATLGLWPPQVVVPPAFEGRHDRRQRDLMLEHERAHVRRRDPWANAAAAALRCLFWFNPLLQLAVPRFRQDQELACDATVLGLHPGARRCYGEALLNAQLHGPGTPLGCHFGFGHPLRERIAMLREQLPSTSRRAAGTLLVSVLALGVGFAAWAAQPQDAADPQVAPPATGDAVSPRTPPPRYPAYALENGIEGRVVLIVDVAADGSVTNAVVERSEPAGVFDAEALAAARQWKFNPAMKDGEPVAGQVRVPIDFRQDPGKGADGAAYDWIRIDRSREDIAELDCDAIKGDASDGFFLCGKFRG